ncbi:MAG TPA: hypothetical protein VJR27_00910 [Candidatus Saccharimonadales bacterium]|nr:hypothetical protein [Candidatus Saccharimonadales bacterium]
MQKRYFQEQSIALGCTIATCLVLIGLVWLEITGLNHIISEKISLAVRPMDILIGATIYLKTAIDFAIFIARLMAKNPGLRGRIGIEVGTALGNGVGTMAILLVWAFFREVNWLLALMVFVAALVLLRLAQDTLVHVGEQDSKLEKLTGRFERLLGMFNKITEPLLSRIVPSQSLHVVRKKTFGALLMLAFTVPFILGLDDFAGYVPVFSLVNVFGFVIGVLVGHMLLNISLYISPRRTIKAVKNPVIALVGSAAFIVLAAWGMFESFKLVLHNA